MYAQKSDKFWTSEENFFVYRNYFILVLHGSVHSGAFATSLFQQTGDGYAQLCSYGVCNNLLVFLMLQAGEIKTFS